MVNKNLRCSVSTIQAITENEKTDNKEPAADFETALSATGFGTFNIFIVLALIPIAWANAFDMTSAAFVLASAECDLELTFIRKGLLCSSVYIGMMLTPLFWGFISHRLPKRTLILFGLLIDFLCNILCSIVDSFYIFVILKIITGTIVSGPFTLLTPYLSEFQPKKYRAKVNTWAGLLFNSGFIVPAILAFNVTPLTWTFVLFDREFTAWRLYYISCCIPSILGFIILSFLPETPKMLMENGYLPKAYDLFRRIYVINTRLHSDTYPIKFLESPLDNFNKTSEESKFTKFLETWNDTKELLTPPNLRHFVISNLLQFGSMLSFNTMRLWVPHMFIIINNFDYSRWDPARGNPTICEYLIPGVIPPGLANETFYANHTCIRWHINPSVYINSSIIAASAVGISFLVGLLYTTKLRKKIVLVMGYLIAILSSFGTNWAQLVPLMLTLSASIVVTGRITANIVIAANADVIPIPLRATAVSFITNTGNLASIIGNLVFPALLEFECLSAFIGIGAILIPCMIMSLFTLRSEKKEIKISPS
ncbi:hypothetical protein G9C98_007468 [Cotesia typhae]|uniref:Major facilitator superfamily (MFS) profile domain-containing protein n=2 Tax=Cotesia typhae TaxID=2053667 RepID=A0A8J5QSP6_9HYME|nr:hypothetical protein G9C98_007468 [Cotesia typhae]